MTGPPRAARQFNKVAVRLAGRRFVPVWAVLHHRGRKSGREYATPVAVIATPGTFVIGLPWGRTTDWVRNVIAAGGCTIRWKGRSYECFEPELITQELAVDAAHGLTRRILQHAHFPDGFIQLRHHSM